VAKTKAKPKKSSGKRKPNQRGAAPWLTGLSGARGRIVRWHRTVRWRAGRTSLHRTVQWLPPDYPVGAETAPSLELLNPNLVQIFSKLHQTLRRPSRHYSKVFPRDPWKKIREIVGISNLVKLGNIGSRSEKLEIDLLVAIQQD